MDIKHYHEMVNAKSPDGKYIHPAYRVESESSQTYHTRGGKRKRLLPRMPIGPPAIFTKTPVDNEGFMIYDMFGRPKKI